MGFATTYTAPACASGGPEMKLKLNFSAETRPAGAAGGLAIARRLLPFFTETADIPRSPSASPWTITRLSRLTAGSVRAVGTPWGPLGPNYGRSGNNWLVVYLPKFDSTVSEGSVCPMGW